jgi:hypothetical protein
MPLFVQYILQTPVQDGSVAIIRQSTGPAVRQKCVCFCLYIAVVIFIDYSDMGNMMNINNDKC